MSRHIRYEYEGQVYDLEYTRATVELMERNGFSVEDLQRRPMTMFPQLFQGAFLAHHRHIPKSLIDKMFEQAPNKTDLIATLSDMYSEPILSMIDSEDESVKNGNWTVS